MIAAWIRCAGVSVALVAGACAQGAEVSRERYDALYEKESPDRWEVTKDASALAWGEAALLHGLADMYEATGDVKYLREGVRRSVQAISHRDDKRGVADGSGKVRPGWTMASKYVVGEAELVDGAGKVCLRVRTVPFSSNHLTVLQVEPKGGGKFTLRVSNAFWKREEVFEDVVMDAGAERAVERVINHPHPKPTAKAGKGEGYSQLVRVERVEGAGTPKEQRVEVRPIPLAYVGYLGIVYHPMLRLAEVVKGNEELQREVGEQTKAIATAAEESYADAERLWREGPGEGEGYYLTCERGESFPYDNVPAPMNFQARHACAQLALHRLTGKAVYLERATRICRLLKNRLKEVDGAYVWHYWFEPVTTTGWTRENSPSVNLPEFAAAPNVEDVSHGALEIAMVTCAREAGVVFDDADLRKFARTLLANVVKPDRTGVRARVDGAGDNDAYAPALKYWADLARVEPEAYRVCREVYEKGTREDLNSVGAYLKWERKMTR